MAAQGIGTVSGVTVQVHVGDLAAGVRFYSALLGRGPDAAPHEDFKEWELAPGAWLQLAKGDGPLPHPLRLGVDDLRRSREAVLALGVACPEPEHIPGLAAWCDFTDPWGNRLGLFQDLAGQGGPAEPGGSVHDASLRQPFPN